MQGVTVLEHPRCAARHLGLPQPAATLAVHGIATVIGVPERCHLRGDVLVHADHPTSIAYLTRIGTRWHWQAPPACAWGRIVRNIGDRAPGGQPETQPLAMFAPLRGLVGVVTVEACVPIVGPGAVRPYGPCVAIESDGTVKLVGWAGPTDITEDASYSDLTPGGWALIISNPRPSEATR
jgi:hypothetical protein